MHKHDNNTLLLSRVRAKFYMLQTAYRNNQNKIHRNKMTLYNSFVRQGMGYAG